MQPSIYTCNSYTFHPLTDQAEEFLRGLTPAQWAKFAAACEILTMSFLSGRPPAGRSVLIRGSSVRGLFELRITRPGSPGPQLRLLCVREGQKVLCARGVDKRQPRIPRREIELAERAVDEHRRRRDERGHGARGSARPRAG